MVYMRERVLVVFPLIPVRYQVYENCIQLYVSVQQYVYMGLMSTIIKMY